MLFIVNVRKIILNKWKDTFEKCFHYSHSGNIKIFAVRKVKTKALPGLGSSAIVFSEALGFGRDSVSLETKNKRI